MWWLVSLPLCTLSSLAACFQLIQKAGTDRHEAYRLTSLSLHLFEGDKFRVLDLCSSLTLIQSHYKWHQTQHSVQDCVFCALNERDE